MRNRYSRKPPFRQTKEEILIVCGGQTEKLYFENFTRVFRPSLGNISVVTAVAAKSPVQIVEYAIKARQRNDGYNAVWCVFDKDDFPDFDDAVNYAKSNGIGAAYSNQAFEVWFINHYRLLNTPLHRSKYKDELTKLLEIPYEKSEGTMEKVCFELLTANRVKTAISNTRLGYERHITYTQPGKPSAFESCTTVFRLARSLLNWADE